MQKKMKIRRVLKTVLFFTLFGVLLMISIRVISRPHALYWAEETGMDMIHKYRNEYDVCFAGTSIVIANVSNQELYEKYGIIGVSVGEPVQPLFLTKYVIDEILKYQNPKVIVIDSRGLFYDEAFIQENIINSEEGIVHYALDSIRSQGIKRKALEQIKDQYSDMDWKAYYSRMYDKHTQWKTLTKANFLGYGDAVCMNGNVMLTEINTVNSVIGTANEINPKNVEELLEIRETCEKQGVSVLLMTGYIEENPEKLEALNKICTENRIDHIDINILIEQLGFHGDEHVSDYIHFNVAGACVWTDYLGEYLLSRYELKPHTGRINAMLDTQSELFRYFKAHMEKKITLYQADYFIDFLETLSELNLGDDAVLMAVYDDAAYKLDEEGHEALKKLGLDAEISYQGSYGGVITSDGVQKTADGRETVIITGQTSIIDYEVRSAGAACEKGADISIMVEGKEWANRRRGFNVVVYDPHLSQPLISCTFDTYMYANPKMEL